MQTQEMLQLVEYQEGGEVTSNLPSWKHVRTNVSRLKPGEVLYMERDQV